MQSFMRSMLDWLRVATLSLVPWCSAYTGFDDKVLNTMQLVLSMNEAW